MLIDLTPRLVGDKAIAENPLMMCSTALIYDSLNVYSGEWMRHICRRVGEMMREGKPLHL